MLKSHSYLACTGPTQASRSHIMSLDHCSPCDSEGLTEWTKGEPCRWRN